MGSLKTAVVKKFAIFEKENDLFSRKYCGVPYWQMLRVEVARSLFFREETEVLQRKSSKETLWVKIKRQLGNLKSGLLSCKEARHISEHDFIYFKAVDRQNRFFDYWDSKSFSSFDMSYDYVEGAYSLGIKLFQSAMTYHVRKRFHFLGTDHSEDEFLKILENKLIKEFGSSVSYEEMKMFIQKYIIEEEVLRPFYRRIFDKVKPKAFVVVCYYTSQLYPAYKEAKIRSIPIIEFQHGTIINHQPYWFDDQRGLNNITPDYFLTFGELWSNYIKLLPTTKVVPVGFPYQAEEIQKLHTIATDDKVIIVYPAIIREFEILIDKFADIAVSKGYKIIVKIHPNQVKNVELYYPILVENKNIEVVCDQAKSIYYWLKYGRHHIMTDTTVALEAVVFKSCNICIATDFPHDVIEPILENGLARGFSTPEELLELIEKPLLPEMDLIREKLWKANAADNINAFFREFYMNH